MNAVALHCAVSAAFEGTLAQMRDGNLEFADLHEVLQSYCINPFEPVLVERDESKQGDPSDALWSLFLFAVKYDDTNAVQYMLQLESPPATGTALLTPPESNSACHVMKDTPHLLAFELIVANRNAAMFGQFLVKFKQALTFNELTLLLGHVANGIEEPWVEAIGVLLRSNTMRLVFVCLRSEEKHQILDFMEPLVKKKESKTLRALAKELRCWPYSGFAALRFAGLFHKYGILADGLDVVTEDDIQQFVAGDYANVERLQKVTNSLAKQGADSTAKLQEITSRASEMSQSGFRLEPLDPSELVTMIKTGNSKAFIAHFEGLKARLEATTNEPFGSGVKVGGVHRSELMAELSLHRYVNYQITADEQREILWLPQDEAVQQILYEQLEIYSEDSEQMVGRMREMMAGQVVTTTSWNPLIFAIYYGQTSIVKYIFKVAQEDGLLSLYYLLSDPFQVIQESAEPVEDMKLDERTSLLPLVLCLMTEQSAMLSLLWNQ